MEKKSTEQPSEAQRAQTAASGAGRRYGHAYYLEISRRLGHATELWEDLSTAGYTSVNLPPNPRSGLPRSS